MRFDSSQADRYTKNMKTQVYRDKREDSRPGWTHHVWVVRYWENDKFSYTFERLSWAGAMSWACFLEKARAGAVAVKQGYCDLCED